MLILLEISIASRPATRHQSGKVGLYQKIQVRRRKTARGNFPRAGRVVIYYVVQHTHGKGDANGPGRKTRGADEGERNEVRDGGELHRRRNRRRDNGRPRIERSVFGRSPDFATSFFEKRGLSQCSRGSREKSTIIFGDYISVNLDRRLQFCDISFSVQYVFVGDADSCEDAAYVLAGRVQHLVVFPWLAQHLPFAQRP